MGGSWSPITGDLIWSALGAEDRLPAGCPVVERVARPVTEAIGRRWRWREPVEVTVVDELNVDGKGEWLSKPW